MFMSVINIKTFTVYAAVVSTGLVAVEHEPMPFDSSSDFYSEFACSLCGCTGFLLILLLFFHSAKKMHTGRMHFFTTSCFADCNHFCLVRHFGLLSCFTFYFHVMTQAK